eukprot:3571607-Rhodomonas_salina.1
MAFFGITSLGPPNMFSLYRCVAAASSLHTAVVPSAEPTARATLVVSLAILTFLSHCRHGDISGVSKEDFFAAFRFIAGGKGTVSKEQVTDAPSPVICLATLSAVLTSLLQVKDVLYEALGGTESDNGETDDFLKNFEEGECPHRISL